MAEDTKPCPVCGEEIKAVAKKCVECGEFIAPRAGCSGWLRASWAEIAGDKTLWDLVSLLIVPIVLAVGGFYLSGLQDQRQKTIEDGRATAQAEVEENRAQETALQNYYEEMRVLLIDKELLTSPEAQAIARARTLAVLRGLDENRKSMLIRFLDEAKLIQTYDRNTPPVISLYEADLAGAVLSRADLTMAKLRFADLSGADLSGAVLVGADLAMADLSKATLSGAELSRAILSGANLRGADLYRANLREAELFDADLTGADLSGAVLSQAVLRGNELREVRYNDATIWPDGFTPPPDAIKED